MFVCVFYFIDSLTTALRLHQNVQFFSFSSTGFLLKKSIYNLFYLFLSTWKHVRIIVCGNSACNKDAVDGDKFETHMVLFIYLL